MDKRGVKRKYERVGEKEEVGFCEVLNVIVMGD